MRTTRGEFVKGIGIGLASLMMARCTEEKDDPRTLMRTCYEPTVAPLPTPTPTEQLVQQTDVLTDVLKDGDLDSDTASQARTAIGRERLRACWLRLDWLARRAKGEIEESERARNELVADHRAALDELVDTGGLDAAVADQVQIAFGEAAFHVWRSNAPITCYIALPAEYEPRDDLVLRADALLETAGDVDSEALAQAQAAVMRDIAFFEALETEASDAGQIAKLWESGEIETSPEVIEAARYLVELLLEE